MKVKIQHIYLHHNDEYELPGVKSILDIHHYIEHDEHKAILTCEMI